MTPLPWETRRIFVYAGLAYLAFVIYGSLVPMDLVDVDWNEALQKFRAIPYLELGIASRADWIANALLYIPLTFVWSGIVDRADRRSIQLFTCVVVLFAAIALIFAVEFAQLFFPPRTVSINDLVAEGLGSIAGVVLWMIVGARITGWLTALRRGGRAATSAALSLYVLVYVGLSLFPFDFVVSVQEFTSKLANGYDSMFLTVDAYMGKRQVMVQLLLEVIAALPVGMMVASLLKPARGSKLGTAMLVGAMLGGVIELIQLFIYSGTAQGASVLTRMAGAALGAAVNARYPARRSLQVVEACFRFRRLALLVMPIYLAGLGIMQHWRFVGWMDWGNAIGRLHEIRFLPFYYHYFTSEVLALRSLLAISVAYAPVGVIWFLVTRAGGQHGVAASAGLAALLAAIFEFAKLFQPHLRPDPTNILIAAVAAAAVYGLMNWIWKLSISPTTTSSMNVAGVPKPLATAEDGRGAGGHGPLALLAVACLGILVWAVTRYPLGGFWLATGLLAYVVVLRRWQQSWLVILPAALPVLDLANWTGRFYFDEFDCLVLATVGAGASGWRRSPSSYGMHPSALLVLALFSVSTFLALLIGAYPYPAFDLNSFNNYYSPYNVLRVGKGLVCALLLVPLLKRELERDALMTHRLFAFGMTLGILAAGAVILWERVAFTGLFNFSSAYRVSGMFSGMHVGGAYVEGYLVTALPFVVWWTLTARRWIGRVLGAGAFVIGSYAILVTYARGGYIGLALSMLTLAICFVFVKKTTPFQLWRITGGAVLLVLLVGVTWPVAHGTFAQGRFSAVERDMRLRAVHWAHGLGMMNDTIATTLFGMGLGSYPGIYLWRNSQGIRSATYSFKKEVGNSYLTLGGGDPLYFEQLVEILPGHRYRLSFNSRSRTEQAELVLPVCEKWMLYSSACTWQTVYIGDTRGQWKRYTVEFNTDEFFSRALYALRPVKLSLSNPTKGAVIDVDQLSLSSEDGKELLRNGDFEEGMDRWSFSIDNYWPWHLDNTWLQLYFEQGLIGLSLFVMLLIFTALELVRRKHEQGFPISGIAAALVGFLTVGTVNSLFEFPRMILLFYVIIAMILLQPRRHKRHRPAAV